MKIKLVTFISLLAMGIIILIQCRKEDSSKMKPDDPSIDQDEMIQRSREIVNKINCFKISLSSPQRENEEFEIDSALWYWETTINYDYSFPDSSYYRVVYFTSNFSTPILESNKISEENLNDTYNRIEDSLTMHYNSINYTFKHLVVADVREDSVGGSTLFTTVYYVFGVNSGTYASFGTTDYWYWGWDLGRCNGSGTGAHSDGSDELAARLNNPNPPIGPDIRFDEIEFVLTDPFEWEVTNNPYGDFRIFYDGGYGANPPSEPCMIPNELTYYLWEGHDLIYDYPPDGMRVPGKDFISITIYDSQCNTIIEWCRLHEYKIYYGEPYIYNPD
jgi:hypothetical protein